MTSGLGEPGIGKQKTHSRGSMREDRRRDCLEDGTTWEQSGYKSFRVDIFRRGEQMLKRKVRTLPCGERANLFL